MKAALIFLMILAAAGARAGMVSGVVRDEQNAALKDARVTLANYDNGPVLAATTSDELGRYHFLSLPEGSYRLQASLSGFTAGPSVPISVSAASPHMTIDLTLSRAASHPQFEASGIRGLIDPGGYSASANAAAASGVIKGIADIKRTGNDPTAKDSPPCSAEPALKEAVEEKPEDVDANLRLGNFYLGHGQAAKAIPLLEHARSLDQRVLKQLAEGYLEAGRFESADSLLTTSSATQVGTEKLRLLARAKEGEGNFIAAAGDYQTAAKQDPSEENLFGAGYELILAGQPTEAERAFQAGLERYPRSAKLLIGLGSAQFLEGQSGHCIPTLLRAAELNPADPRPYPFLAEASAVSRVDMEQVHQAFERFLSAAPDNSQASYDLALNLLQQHAAGGANDSRIEALLKRAILLDPRLADAHFQLGVFYANRREYQLASQELATAVRLSPNLEEAHYRLAVTYRETGQKDLSSTEMQRFEEQRKASAGQPMGGNIDQFISVFAAPKTGADGDTLCPGGSPPAQQ